MFNEPEGPDCGSLDGVDDGVRTLEMFVFVRLQVVLPPISALVSSDKFKPVGCNWPVDPTERGAESKEFERPCMAGGFG